MDLSALSLYRDAMLGAETPVDVSLLLATAQTPCQRAQLARTAKHYAAGRRRRLGGLEGGCAG